VRKADDGRTGVTGDERSKINTQPSIPDLVTALK